MYDRPKRYGKCSEVVEKIIAGWATATRVAVDVQVPWPRPDALHCDKEKIRTVDINDLALAVHCNC
jgi:hypothetical protein